MDEFKIKRAEVFEFTEKPSVHRDGDKTTIRFASKAACDVTVVIEDAEGKVLRHLVSGCLGPNPPAPLAKDSLTQSIVWDGKDDQDQYIDKLSGVSVRVSLGLKADFERSLYWEPKKRSQYEALGIAAAPEGVYIYDGRVFDHVRLFDHQGNYVRTVYPFPADKLAAVKGLHWTEHPHDGSKQAMKEGFHMSTFLTSGRNAGFDEKIGFGVDEHNNWHGSVSGNAATMLAVRGTNMALGELKLDRLSTDGSSGGMELTGPDIAFPIVSRATNGTAGSTVVPPRSAAFSPDGQWLYLTGYVFAHRTAASRDIMLVNFYDWLPGVVRVKFADGAKVEQFLGGMEVKDAGTDNAHFQVPSSVAVDQAGRVYVTDYVLDRVQVYDATGKFLKSIPSESPAQVCINQKTGQIYVFSFYLPNVYSESDEPKVDPRLPIRRKPKAIPTPKLAVLKSFDDPKVELTCDLDAGSFGSRGSGMTFRAELDCWAENPTVWIALEWGFLDIMSAGKLGHPNVRLLAVKPGKAELIRDFNEDARQSVAQTDVADYQRQRLYVNPATGDLFIGEGHTAVGKAFKDVVKVNPETGKCSIVNLPFDAEDMCFDAKGLAYLRTFYYVARYDPGTWREVPWDYGEEAKSVSTSSSSDRRTANVASGVRLPVKDAGLHHHGGMNISPRGHLVIAVNNYGAEKVSRKDIYDDPILLPGQAYVPPIWPGRVRWGEIHVFDEHGKMIFEDAVPGMNRTDGVGIDRNDNIYGLSTEVRMLDGKPYFSDMSGTLFKVPPKASKLLSLSPRAAVPLQDKPKAPLDFASGPAGPAWLEGANWLYGGLSFSGKNASRSGGGCDCYNARFALDYLARSFAPEITHNSVAVLDSNGNLIMRIGKYGNESDGKPLIGDGDPGEPGRPRPRSIGGDEVGLFYPAYLGVHTDKRLFIADTGNSRIVSVKLSYHATEKAPLK